MAPPTPEHVWTSPETLDIPTTDILAFAFDRLGRFDNNKPIFIDAIDPTRFFSAARARQTVRHLAQGLKQHGLEDGDCVCLHSYNRIEYPVLWLAIIAAGGVVLGTNPASTVSELVRHFNLTRPKFIVAQIESLPPVLDATEECGIPSSNLFYLGTSDTVSSNGCQSWESLLSSDECDRPVGHPQGQWAPDRIAVYAMTSGTTGLPKAALISHRYVVAQTTVLEVQLGDRSYQPSQLICLPVFHAFASPLALVLPLRSGIPTYFLPRFNLASFTNAIHRFSVTDIPVVPPIIAELNHLPASQHHLLRTLRYVICAGAPMTATVQTELYNLLAPKAVIAQCWGTTESGWITLFNPDERDTSGSVGRPMPNVRLKLVDENKNILSGDGLSGEAFVHSPALFSGYLGNPKASADSFDSDGFYGTGDRVYVRNGKVFHTGRIKEILKVHGWQVSPTEIEAVLLEHPQILDVAVIGVAVDRSGIPETLPCAYVVRGPAKDKTGNILEESDVTDFVASRLISYKRLTGGVVFVKAIPRSSTGKILRRLLEDAVKDDLDQSNQDKVADDSQ